MSYRSTHILKLPPFYHEMACGKKPNKSRTVTAMFGFLDRRDLQLPKPYPLLVKKFLSADTA